MDFISTPISFVTECPEVAWIRDDMVLADPYDLAAGYRPVTVAHPDIEQAGALGAGVVLDIAQ